MMINLIDRIKLLFRKDKGLFVSIYNLMGFYPSNIDIYKVALAHKSSKYRNEKGKPFNNERLEYLGDAVLETVVSDILYHYFGNKHEGFLSSTRSKIVQRETLNDLSKKMGLDLLIRKNAINESHNNLGGNAFEALMGAIYLDRGFEACKLFFEKQVLGKHINLNALAKKETNFKSKLLEWCQKNRVEVAFTMDAAESPNNANRPLFKSIVMIEGLNAGEGTGLSKKESQQNSAKEAITKLRRQPQFIAKVLAEKEKRTAMEAAELSEPPAIDTNSVTVAGDNDRSNLQLITRKSHRKRNKKAGKTAEAQQESPSSGETTEVFADDLIVRVNTPEVAKVKEEECLKTLPKATAGTTGKPRGNNATGKPQSERLTAKQKEREAIIQAAEEAAFGEM